MSPNKVTRENPRVRIDMEAKQLTHQGKHLAQIKDLSVGGAFLINISPQSFDNQLITIELSLPKRSDSLWITGKIVRNELADGKDGVGIEFTHINDYDKQCIEDYVASLRG